ncbi:WhiB family transcriptional regulator [Mycobacterium sp. CBMA247]|nr:WhiB family transcriptional regulator [Mycolicibacterium sp. CBMA 329]MUL88537.1 WhiB family transcriptional regulator [Mycolicibacterium sp. CBMA 331]MUM00124.1 WhiB family transcriptional regulator [Mycolicibacterium sp. CBMA 334]MUM27790.1 WhiB family transcriptional regulator [Mycolicibacterium sp. CBMA 295]MUM40184.1 WhiB family transcriptional regulator [Mycolicibacterium sp. CBMA 247]MUM44602.1 WhiB family transcriptional regulator [Mycolicibacterium sp. CBMA 294]
MRLPQQLPGPNADHWDWQMRAQCRGADLSVFFAPEGERGRARLARERRAKALCVDCPVLAQCRGHALAIAEPFGVWGGLSEGERARMLGIARSSVRDRHSTNRCIDAKTTPPGHGVST